MRRIALDLLIELFDGGAVGLGEVYWTSYCLPSKIDQLSDSRPTELITAEINLYQR